MPTHVQMCCVLFATVNRLCLPVHVAAEGLRLMLCVMKGMQEGMSVATEDEAPVMGDE